MEMCSYLFIYFIIYLILNYYLLAQFPMSDIKYMSSDCIYAATWFLIQPLHRLHVAEPEAGLPL